MRLQNFRNLTLVCALLSFALLASPTLAQTQRRGQRGNIPGGFAEGRLMKKHAKRSV